MSCFEVIFSSQSTFAVSFSRLTSVAFTPFNPSGSTTHASGYTAEVKKHFHRAYARMWIGFIVVNRLPEPIKRAVPIKSTTYFELNLYLISTFQECLKCESMRLSILRRSFIVDEVIHRLSTLFQALGNGIRLQILQKLQEDSRNVSELADYVDRPMNAVSRHLRILRDNKLVKSVTEGRSRVYSLKRPNLVRACFALKSFLERSDE